MSNLCFQTPKQTILYNNNSKLQYKWAIELLLKSEHLFCDNCKVIDIGCGDGKVTVEMLEIIGSSKIGSIVGIDGSASQIQFANNNYCNNDNKSKIMFSVMKLDEINYVETFDIAFGSCIFHWQSDQGAIFGRVYNALKTGGYFIFVGPAANKFNISVISDGLSKTEKWNSYFNDFISNRSYHTKEEYHKILSDNRFDVIEIKETVTSTPFDNRAALKNWIRPLSVWANHLPNVKQEEFIEDIVDIMFDQKLSYVDGKIIMESIKVEVCCIKK